MAWAECTNLVTFRLGSRVVAAGLGVPEPAVSFVEADSGVSVQEVFGLRKWRGSGYREAQASLELLSCRCDLFSFVSPRFQVTLLAACFQLLGALEGLV